jgi:hypothetical protein
MVSQTGIGAISVKPAKFLANMGSHNQDAVVQDDALT